MEKAFDKKTYDNEYKKKHKKLFTARINIEEMDELNKLLDKLNISHSEFVINAMNELKKKHGKVTKNEDKTA